MKRKSVSRVLFFEDSPFERFVRALKSCAKTQSGVLKKQKLKPPAIKHVDYLNHKTDVYFGVNVCDNKEELLNWITKEFAPVWHEIIEKDSRNNADFLFHTKMKKTIFEQCDKTQLFTEKEMELIDVAFEEEELSSTQPLSLSRSDTLPFSLAYEK